MEVLVIAVVTCSSATAIVAMAGAVAAGVIIGAVGVLMWWGGGLR